MSERPDPDDLLRPVNEEEEARKAKRGKLTVFFGAAPGVGKTYAMLEAARSDPRFERGEVVAGLVETHGRSETNALLSGLEILPRRNVDHPTLKHLEEFDLDAALARNPGLLLVDELAHTNAPGSRHPKRWQDVEELLEAGIEVYTTLNVQHLESLNDVVAQITGIRVRETVPDSVIEHADDVRLLDLPADELLERLREGKVYVQEDAGRAADNFFRKGNLHALRELALRRTAEGVDLQVRTWKEAEHITRTWPVAERILVGVTPSPDAARLVRAACRMASGLKAEWIAAYVETPASLRMWNGDRDRLARNLRLAEQLGAETITLSGHDIAEEMLRYARSRNATKIVVGKPLHRRWLGFFQTSFLDAIVRGSKDVDIYVISGDERTTTQSPAPPPEARKRPLRAHLGYVAAIAVNGLVTLAAGIVLGRSRLPEVVIVYLLVTALVSMRFGYHASLFAALLSVVLLGVLFAYPHMNAAAQNVRDGVTLSAMFVGAVVISGLMWRLREQADAARDREMRTARLYAMNREFASTVVVESLLRIAARHLHEDFDCAVAILLPDDSGALAPAWTEEFSFTLDATDDGVAEWVWNHEKAAGLTTDTLPAAKSLFVPLRGSRERVGVLGVRPTDERRFVNPEQRQRLDAYASQVASALEPARLAEEAHRAQLEAHRVQLRAEAEIAAGHPSR
jgi:two-component system, OmpR family, sensor histidine kinase KdpD